MKTQTVAQALATAIQARENSQRSNNTHALEQWNARVQALEDMLPSGCGFDAGTTINIMETSARRLVFVTAYHSMNEHGYYTKWRHHKIVCVSTFDGISVSVGGKNDRMTLDYIGEVFHAALSQDAPGLVLVAKDASQ